MENLKLLKNVELNLTIGGNGGISYDSLENQKDFAYSQYGVNYKNSNANLLKKNFYGKDGDGTKCKINGEDKTFKVKISSEALKREILGQAVPASASKTEQTLMMYYARPENLLRGFMNVSYITSYSKKHSYTLIDAELTNSASPTLEVKTSSGYDDINDTKGKTSLFYKETIGESEYKSFGIFNIRELQFISASKLHGRQAINPDWITSGEFVEYIKAQNPCVKVDFKVGYFTCPRAGELEPEFGILLNEEFVFYLIKLGLKNTLQFAKSKANAYCATKAMKIRLVNDITTLDRSEDEWIEIRNFNDIDNLDFGHMYEFYVEASEEAVKHYEEGLSKAREEAQKKKQEQEENE